MKDVNALAAQYFTDYPGERVLHITSDGQVFLNANKGDGVNHQRELNKVDAEAKLRGRKSN
jgi:hypothetical protein